jgi:hypothetical protein
MEETVFEPFTELTDQTWENLSEVYTISDEEVLIDKIKQIRAKYCLSFNEALEILKVVEIKKTLENISNDLSRVPDSISDLRCFLV